MSLRFRIVFASACALLVVVLCVAYADSVREEADRVRSEALARYGGEVVSLVVSPEGLQAGEQVSRSNVKATDWVAELSPQGAITSLDSVVGRKITVPVAAGAPLTELNFRESNEMGEVPSGHVALSVPVTEKLGLSSAVSAGTRVVAYESVEGGAKLLSDDVTVMDAPGSTSGLGVRSSLTVAVPPEFVSAILTAGTAGDLRIVVPAQDVSGLGQSEVSAPSSVGSTQVPDGEADA